MVCVPTSLTQEAQAGEAKLREVIGAGGFSKIRRAAETPFNMILEARRLHDLQAISRFKSAIPVPVQSSRYLAFGNRIVASAETF